MERTDELRGAALTTASRQIPHRFELLDRVPVDAQRAARGHDEQTETAIADDVQLFARGVTNFSLEIGMGHRNTFQR
jgi:hypothetical protein